MHVRYWRGTILACGVFFCSFPAFSFDAHVRGSVEPELWYFFESSSEQNQKQVSASLAAQVAIDLFSDSGVHHFAIEPFGRIDWRDRNRSHFDLRQAKYQMAKGGFDLIVGIDKVYWGVMEAVHLVDVINQTDAVESSDGEEKLGQPMVRLSYESKWGTVSAFALPFFRERAFPGEGGRLRPDFNIDESRATFESDKGKRHIDWAVRYQVYLDDIEIGVSHFQGTAREPIFTPVIYRNGQEFTSLSCPPTSFRLGLNLAKVVDDCRILVGQLLGLPLGDIGDIHVELAPHYPLMKQTSIDFNAVLGSWLLKAEALNRFQRSDRYIQATFGFEYSFYGIFSGQSDLGLIVEYVWDERGVEGRSPFQNDLFVGARWALNDVSSTSVLAGSVIDLGSGAMLVTFEAERRLGSAFKVSAELRSFVNIPDSDPIATLSDDSFVQVRLSWYF